MPTQATPSSPARRSEGRRVFIQLVPALVIIFAGLIFLWQSGLWYAAVAIEEASRKGDPMARERVHAPELTGGVAWLNIDRPLTLASLTGKVVLLDFWTYCCINCMHVIPELKKLEAKYPDHLVVIGIHAAKFPNEKDSENIRQAILRYEITHPVVNDREFRILQRYGVRSWPTLVLIDPEGYVVGGISGEGHYDALDRVIGDLVRDHQARGTLNSEPLQLVLERTDSSASELSFPGKVLADPERDRVFIADSNHHRILIATKNGKVFEVAGTGEMGADDGGFNTATFHNPQGMAVDGNILYVADTGNHLIRQLDLQARTVTTVAGTGALALRDYRHGPAREIALSSPWDLVLENGVLYIAMAGPHQIWAMQINPATHAAGAIGPYAGTSQEARIDGPLKQAAFAQPSGITSDGTSLYVADSEISAVRAVSLHPDGVVSTIVGRDLFEFGDTDGQGEQVRLQHPLGITHHNGVLYLADTYNHKIKAIGPRLQTATTFLGTGKPGQRDGENAEFYEPSGVSIAEGKLYIADTNNHAIRVADLHTKEVTTLLLSGLPEASPVSPIDIWPNLEDIHVPTYTVHPGRVALTLNVEIPTPYKLSPGSPLRHRIQISNGADQTDELPANTRVTVPDGQFPLHVPVTITETTTRLYATVNFVYCRDGNGGACFLKSLHWNIPVRPASEGDTEISLQHVLVPESLPTSQETR
jgi:thiol-disulfide isomerase/thioredoxin